ncbi:hypothetical protein [Deinococcus sedimenti]|uniref:Uncharacterized protein n=1 Tax=Deinococcus sedimenti TaxID=1867090 RepID=A0ABQ2SCJ1_9DEIO|nr:hypothetical protein [Deinococcus sedimenti]GGS10326.1 hypothetical protein GCM10008960_40580 [Deinococcus sedimenti]
MTTPDPLSRLSDEVQRLSQIVDGNPGMNVRPIRVVTDEIQTTVKAIQSERDKEKAFQQGIMRVLTFLGGTSLLSIVGLIAALLKLFGGTP